MALQNVRSSTADKRPNPASLSDGQLAINTAASTTGLFYKNASGALVKAGPVYIGTTAPNATPAAGGHAGNSVGETWLDTAGANPILKVWDGSTWRVVQPVTSGTVVSTADTGTVTSTMIANGTIVDADVNASAAIAGTKISPSFGAQNITTTGTSTAASYNPTSSTVPTNGVYLPAANSVGISTNGAGRLFINSSGQVGINNSNPTLARLTSTTSSGTALRLESSDAAGFQIEWSGPGSSGGLSTPASGITDIRANGASNLTFTTNSNERLRITSAGLVGIGTSAPSYPLHIRNDQTATTSVSVQNASAGAGAYAQFRVDGDSGQGYFGYSGSGSGGTGLYEADYVYLASENNASGLNLGATSGAIRLYTGGVAAANERLRITSAGNVGIGTTSPGTALQVVGTARFGDGTNGSVSLTSNASQSFYDSLNNAATGWQTAAFRATNLTFLTDASSTPTERARIDSSGRLLVGTSTARANLFNSTVTSRLQVEGSGVSDPIASIISSSSSGSVAATLVLGKQNSGAVGGNTIVESNNLIGGVSFQGNDGAEFVEAASIYAQVDGTPGANDMPGRLVFSTTADGASSPTERLRITSTGQVRLAGAGITFNGDTATANELDDYEEGTWTPVLSDGTNNATNNGSAGHYTKVGNIVTVHCRVQISSLGSVSGNTRITGLPFTVATGTYSAVAAGYGAGLAITAGTSIGVYPISAQTYCPLYVWSATTGTTTMTSSNWTATGQLLFSITYRAA